MKTNTAARHPPIQMVENEADALTDLAISVADRLPQVSELLLREIGRASFRTAEAMPKDIITMFATVQFLDEASGKTSAYQLVYPKEADIAAGRVRALDNAKESTLAYWLVAPLPQWRQKKVKALVEALTAD